MSTARKYVPRYTVADYLTWSGEWELWDGIPVAMTPGPFGQHQAVVANLLVDFRNALAAQGCSCQAIHELDWHVDERTVVRPDLVVLCQGIPKEYLTRAPVVAVEVLSPITEEKDRTAKFELYQEQHVLFYLIADPNSGIFTLYHLANGVYEIKRNLEMELPDGCKLSLSESKALR